MNATALGHSAMGRAGNIRLSDWIGFIEVRAASSNGRMNRRAPLAVLYGPSWVPMGYVELMGGHDKKPRKTDGSGRSSPARQLLVTLPSCDKPPRGTPWL